MRFRFFYVVTVACIVAMSPSALAKDGSQPIDGGGKHTVSHGGTYQGRSGSSHKGGTYKNPPSGESLREAQVSRGSEYQAW